MFLAKQTKRNGGLQFECLGLKRAAELESMRLEGLKSTIEAHNTSSEKDPLRGADSNTVLKS